VFQDGFIVLFSAAVDQVGVDGAGSGQTKMILLVLGGVAALAAASVAGFLFRSWINKVAVEFEAFALESVMSMAVTLDCTDHKIQSQFAKGAATGGARISGRSLRLNLQGTNDLSRARIPSRVPRAVSTIDRSCYSRHRPVARRSAGVLPADSRERTGDDH
jgi:hypothetical protein